jgi:multidrug efflux pump subunit AcrA (membrane-fusion protein)
VPEYPNQTFTAKLATSSNAVTAQSGTVLTELVVDNAKGLLKAGDYAQVNFVMPPPPAGASGTVLRVPSSALLFRKAGTQIAVLGPQDRVRIAKVTVGRDLGSTIEILSGLSPQDRVIDNPPDSIVQGELVRVAPGAPQHAPASDAAG